MTVQDRPTSEILDLTIQQLQKHGWAKGSGWRWTAPYSRICLEGGLLAALGIDIYAVSDQPGSDYDEATDHHTAVMQELTSCPAYQAVWEFVKPQLAGTWQTRLYDWNDDPAVTYDRVIDTLAAVSAIEKVKEAARGEERD